jgi:hypothetical protein
VGNQKEFFGEGFKGDKTFLLIILLAKWVYLPGHDFQMWFDPSLNTWAPTLDYTYLLFMAFASYPHFEI